MEQQQLNMSFLAQTTDVNYHGNVHGGKVMKWIDEAAYALAVRYARKNCVTKFVDDIEFLEAIHIGDLVYLTATLIRVGTTSIWHMLKFQWKLDWTSEERKLRCDIVFVAIDKQGKKTNIKD